MSLISNLELGFSVALSATNLLYCMAGVTLGTLIGVLPGLGPMATIALLLPLTFGIDPMTSLIMLAGIYYGAQYGGSTTAILLNLPGESSSAITTIDGYEMARQGRAGPALAIAALGSFAAGTIATLVIALVAIPLSGIALMFGAAEYFALMVFGLVSSVALASGSVIKSVGMIAAGLLLGLTGTDLYTGDLRFAFGATNLFDGIDFVAIAAGMFGIAEIARNLESRQVRSLVVDKVKGLWPTRSELKQSAGAVGRGTLIGSILGVLPGGGAMLSSFVAYNIEKKVSRNSARFGKGAIEGVAAPEAANNAGAQTSFIPMLSLGIPSNPIMALMIGALIMNGIVPGPGVISGEPALFWGLIASMWVGNLMLVFLNLPLVGLWVRVLKVPYDLLFPAVMVISCIGVYSVQNASFSVFILAGAGIAGYFLTKFGCELPPFILGFVIGPLIEEHLRRAMMIADGNPMVLLTSPISAVLLGLSALALIAVSLPAIRGRRDDVFCEQD